MPNFKAGDNAPVEAWLFSEENTEPFPAHFGEVADHPAGTGKAEVTGPDGLRTTIGPNTYVVLGPNGNLDFVQKRTFQRVYQETSERPQESMRQEFERRRAHPGEVATGSEGRARQGVKFVGGEAGRDKESAKRSEEQDMGNNADPSGLVPGAPVGVNTGGSPHEVAAQAAQPELVQRGTDAKVEDPSRPAAESPARPGSGPEATESKVAPGGTDEDKEADAASAAKKDAEERKAQGAKSEEKREEKPKPASRR